MLTHQQHSSSFKVVDTIRTLFFCWRATYFFLEIRISLKKKCSTRCWCHLAKKEGKCFAHTKPGFNTTTTERMWVADFHCQPSWEQNMKTMQKFGKLFVSYLIWKISPSWSQTAEMWKEVKHGNCCYMLISCWVSYYHY